MSTTLKRLAGPAQLGNSAATIYTVPTATLTVIRHLHFFNADSVAHTVRLSVGADAAGTRWYDQVSVPATSELDRFCLLVMTAAEILQSYADTASKVTYTVDGEERTLG